MSEFQIATFSLAMLCASCLPGTAKPARLPPGFVRLSDVAPNIRQDMRYAGPNNFLGRPVPGYGATDCWLRQEVAQALAAVQKDAGAEGLSLIVYDCYRPIQATKAFIAWAEDQADQATKQDYYPKLEKNALFELGYISKTSAHSTGTAVDLAIEGADFGTHFDSFDPASATHFASLSENAKANRMKLLRLMAQHGFENLSQEWWHFSLKGLEKAQSFDFEIK
jgi:D-alanyl-D-alanine dipeptidase